MSKEQDDKKKTEEKISTYTNVAQEGAATEVVQRYGSAAKEHLVAYSGVDNETGKILKRGLKKTAQSTINPEYEKQNIKQQAGFAAEDKYTARQNAENIINKKPERISRTDDAGSVNDQLYDHVQLDANGNWISGTGEQMKFVGNSPKAALDKLSSQKFQKYIDADAKITVPSDFYDGIKEEADKQIKSLENQLEHANKTGNTELVTQKQQEIAKYKKIKSLVKDSGISNKEALEARLHARLSTAKDVAKISHRAGVEQAKYGAVISGSVSLVRNLVSVVKGEKDAGEAAASVVVDTATGTAVSYATAFAGSSIKGAMQNAGNEVVRTLSKTNIAATVVTTTLEVGNTLKKYIGGEIDGVECLQELGEKGTSQLSAAMFAVAGQAVIPIPIVGAAIGSMLGYALASSCYNELVTALQEAKIAREERIRIERECAEAIEMIMQYKHEMEEFISNYLTEQISAFNKAFDQIDEAIYNDDIDGFIAGNNMIQKQLGYKSQFNSFDEFDALMKGSQTFKI